MLKKAVKNIKREKQILPGRGSQAYTILSLIAISGELPVNQIKRLSGGSRYKEQVVKKLKSKQLIHTYYNDKLRGLRLTLLGKKELLSENKDRFISTFTGNSDTNQPKYETTRRLRLRNIAETLVTMKNADVSIYRDEKPDVFYCDDGRNTAPDLEITSSFFYTSREVKGLGAEVDSIQGAISVGVLLTPLDIFIVYNTGDSSIKWDYSSESRMRALMNTTLCYNNRVPQYQHESIRSIMLGNDMQQMYNLLINTGKAKRNIFALEGNDDSFMYLTNDYKGEVILKLLCNSDKTDELNQILSEDLYAHDNKQIVENDAMDENDEPVLFAYDCNMPRIMRFNSALTIHNRKGTLICFDFQADVLRRFCSKNVTFQTIDFAKFEGRFFS